MCFKQKCNFYFQKYDILVILSILMLEIPMILAEMLPGTGSAILIRTRVAKMIRIHITALD